MAGIQRGREKSERYIKKLKDTITENKDGKAKKKEKRMKKHTKLLTGFLIGISLAFGVPGAMVKAGSYYTAKVNSYAPEKYVDEQGICYRLDENTEEYSVTDFEQKYDTSGKPIITQITIPDMVYFRKVTKMEKAFAGHKELTFVQIGKNIRETRQTFEGCTGLKEVDLKNVQTIGDRTFKGCDTLQKVVAKEVEGIGQQAFMKCGALQNINIGYNLNYISDQAFYNCKKLSKIRLPKDSIGRESFKNCINLSKADFYKKSKDYTVDKNAFQNTKLEKKAKKKKRPLIVQKTLISVPYNIKKVSIDGKKISCVASGAFLSGTKVNMVTIKNVNNIHYNMFLGCKTKELVIYNAKYMDDNVFEGLARLKKATITGKVSITSKMIGYLKNPKKLTLYVNASRVNTLQKKLKCKVRAISKKKIVKGAFYQDTSFQGNKAVEDDQGIIYQDNGGTYSIVGFKQKYDANGNALTVNLVIPAKINDCYITGMSDKVFADRKEITSVIFENGSELVEISKEAFRGCNKLEKVVLPNTITYIQNKAFMDCTGLKDINFPDNLYAILDSAFRNDVSLQNIHFSQKLNLVGYHSFENCTSITEISFASKIRAICAKAFYQCKALEKVSISNVPESLNVSADAWNGTKWLTAFTEKNQPAIANGVLLCGTNVDGKVVLNGKDIKLIAGYSFAKGKKLKELQITGVDHIGENAFEENALQSANIKNVKKMDKEIFKDTKKLTKLSVSGMKKINYMAFANMRGLKKVTLGKDVSEIGLRAFSGCDKLVSVRFNTTKKVTWECKSEQEKTIPIEPLTFAGCRKLRHVYMKSTAFSKDMVHVLGRKVTLHVPQKVVKKYWKSAFINCKVAAQK